MQWIRGSRSGRARRRRSQKWRLYPPDVLPAFVAEMDYDLAGPVVAALRAAVDRQRLRVRHRGRARRDVRRVRRGQARLDGRPRPGVPGARRDGRRRHDAGAGHRARRRRGHQPAGVPAVLRAHRLRRPAGGGGAADPGGRALGTRLRRAGGGVRRGRARYLLCNPHNPTGRVFSADDLGRIAALAGQYGVLRDSRRDPRLADPARRPAHAVRLARRGGGRARGDAGLGVQGVQHGRTKGAVAVAGSAAGSGCWPGCPPRASTGPGCSACWPRWPRGVREGTGWTRCSGSWIMPGPSSAGC